jgi:hypothetical protein
MLRLEFVLVPVALYAHQTSPSLTIKDRHKTLRSAVRAALLG